MKLLHKSVQVPLVCGLALRMSLLTSLAAVDDDSWIGMGFPFNGFDRFIDAACVDSSGNLYAFGRFWAVGDTTIPNGVAKWDGSRWSAALGSRPPYDAFAVAVSSNYLYAAGSGVARWDGTNWSALGSAFGPPSSGIYALAVSGSDIYAAGSFATADGVPALSIAKWDGSRWSALGLGIRGVVYALAVSGNDVYAAGDFIEAGGSPASNIAKWDGSSWSALGLGIEPSNFNFRSEVWAACSVRN